MAHSSEDVLLIVSHVKYKKVDGSFYVMSTRVAWMNQTGVAFRISAPYEDTRIQRVSPDTKEKVQLQILMNDGTSYTFHFANPQGPQKQLEDRNAVKELIHQLLPKFKHKIHSELEEKRRVLMERPELMSLYKELVVSGILSVDEFWCQPEMQEYLQRKEQPLGVPTHLLSDIQPQTDGANGSKYNLTGDTIRAIFHTYPAVKQKHATLVPHQVSEEDFWIKFFQSHYFHRDRLHIPKDDLFSECASEDEMLLKGEVKSALSLDSLLDLRRVSDHDTVSTGEDAGSSSGNAAEAGSSAGPAPSQVHQQLIRRFNQHSLMVLKALHPAATSDAVSLTKGSQPASGFMPPPKRKSARALAHEAKRARLRAQTRLSDLEPEAVQTQIPLTLDNIDLYLAGPTASNCSDTQSRGTHRTPSALLPPDVAQIAWTCAQNQMDVWHETSLHQCLSGSSALNALRQVSAGELSVTPGGSSSSGRRNGLPSGSTSSGSLLAPELSRDLTRLYRYGGELLRHLWLCFPVTSPQLEAKAGRMYESIVRFQQTKLEPFKAGNPVRTDISLTQHLEDLIDTAMNKYTSWKARNRR